MWSESALLFFLVNYLRWLKKICILIFAKKETFHFYFRHIVTWQVFQATSCILVLHSFSAFHWWLRESHWIAKCWTGGKKESSKIKNIYFLLIHQDFILNHFNMQWVGAIATYTRFLPYIHQESYYKGHTLIYNYCLNRNCFQQMLHILYT